jgi:hypothetical protein
VDYVFYVRVLLAEHWPKLRRADAAAPHHSHPDDAP